jgi:hypothetical protein
MEEEQPPPIYAFLGGLEEAVNDEPYTLAQHLNRYKHDVFTKLSQESGLKATL